MCAPQEHEVLELDHNPFSPVSQATFELTEPTQVVAIMYNVLGEVVDTLHNGPAEAGTLVLPLERDTVINSGIYFIQWKVGDSIHTEKVVLLQ